MSAVVPHISGTLTAKNGVLKVSLRREIRYFQPCKVRENVLTQQADIAPRVPSHPHSSPFRFFVLSRSRRFFAILWDVGFAYSTSVAGAAFLVRAGSYTTVNMAEKRGHPSDAAEASSDPTTLPTSSSQAGDIILTTKALQESTLEDSTRYAAHTRTPAVHPTISGLSTRSCSHQDRL